MRREKLWTTHDAFRAYSPTEPTPPLRKNVHPPLFRIKNAEKKSESKERKGEQQLEAPDSPLTAWRKNMIR